jgi:hypothetical protein
MLRKVINGLESILESLETFENSNSSYFNEDTDYDMLGIDTESNAIIAEVNSAIEESGYASVIDAEIEKLVTESPAIFNEKNIVRIDRTTALHQLVGLCAIARARRRKDPAAILHKKGKMLIRKAKAIINKKYSAAALVDARRLLKNRKFKSV